MDLFALGLKIRADGLRDGKKALAEIDASGKGIAKRFDALTAPINRASAAMRGIASAAVATAAISLFKSAIAEAGDAEAKLAALGQSVTSVGGDFEQLKPALDAAASGIQKLTRFSDDATRGALTQMINISRDTAGSLKNIGLAADIAAAKHIDLESAAVLVGRVMTGNTGMLARYGISVKDGSDAMEQLRASFTGFAEKDAQTFLGRMEQIKNAWADVLEALGDAVIGGGDATNSIDGIRESLEKLEGFIRSNSAAWRSFATSLLSPINWLTKFQNNIQETGFLLYALRTGNWDAFKNSRAMGGSLGGPPDFGDVTGSSAGGGVFGDVTGGASTGARGHNTPSSRTGKTGKAGKAAGISIPNIDINWDSVERDRLEKRTSFDPLGLDKDLPYQSPIPEWLTKQAEATLKAIEDRERLIKERLEEEAQRIVDFHQQIAMTIQSGIAQTIGDAVYNGFAAAFNGEGLGGIFEALGKTVLAGIGGIFTQLGSVWLAYGASMLKFTAFLWNPATSAWAALAIGAALTGLGAALGAVGRGGGPRGGSSSSGGGAGRIGQGTSDITRIRFVDSGTGRMLNEMNPRTPQQFNFSVIGTNDPKAQRDIVTLIGNAERRRG